MTTSDAPAPVWWNNQHLDDDRHFYEWASCHHAETESEARRRALNNAYGQLVRRLFAEVQVDSSSVQLRSKYQLTHVETQDEHTAKGDRGWSCWILVKYPKAEYEKKLAGLHEQAEAREALQESGLAVIPALDSSDAAPECGVSFLFSNPNDAELYLGGYHYDLTDGKTLRLGKGRHSFKLKIPGKRVVYGRMDVLVADDSVAGFTFGLAEGSSLFPPDQIDHVQTGSAVQYAFRVRTPNGPVVAAKYILSLNPM